MNKLIVLSGCSGGGKSTLLVELKQAGFAVVPEVGREIVKEQRERQGDATPWQNPLKFCELAIERAIAAFYKATEDSLQSHDATIFFDRSFLDNISHYQTMNVADPGKYNSFIQTLRFYPSVFMAPPWEEIFSEDEERKHSFASAVEEYERLMLFYRDAGYNVIDIPKVGVKERCQFIIASLK